MSDDIMRAMAGDAADVCRVSIIKEAPYAYSLLETKKPVFWEPCRFMHILVSGGGGYLGGWVTAAALRQGHRVRVFDRFCFLPSDLTPEILFGEGGTEVVRGDIRRLQECPSLLQGIDAVIHLAGLSSDPTCDLDPEMAQEVNVECTRELARLSIEAGVKRFIFASTCAVYGHGVFEILDEESPLNPVSVFARTKLEAEKALLGMASASFVPVVARMGTLFGYSRGCASILRLTTWSPRLSVKDIFLCAAEAVSGVHSSIFKMRLTHYCCSAAPHSRISLAKCSTSERIRRTSRCWILPALLGRDSAV